LIYVTPNSDNFEIFFHKLSGRPDFKIGEIAVGAIAVEQLVATDAEFAVAISLAQPAQVTKASLSLIRLEQSNQESM
jgi:hypothetical protein